jgi:hypothetical protein
LPITEQLLGYGFTPIGLQGIEYTKDKAVLLLQAATNAWPTTLLNEPVVYAGIKIT